MDPPRYRLRDAQLTTGFRPSGCLIPGAQGRRGSHIKYARDSPGQVPVVIEFANISLSKLTHSFRPISQSIVSVPFSAGLGALGAKLIVRFHVVLPPNIKPLLLKKSSENKTSGPKQMLDSSFVRRETMPLSRPRYASRTVERDVEPSLS